RPPAAHSDLPPLPTRRSSDLPRGSSAWRLRCDGPEPHEPADPGFVRAGGRSMNGGSRWALHLRADPPSASRTHHDIGGPGLKRPDRKSTRLNSSHVAISYAVF